MSIDQRLAELGITLPQPSAPVASYVPAVEQGGLLHISGQISFAEDGNLIVGRIGEDMNLERGIGAARRCGVMRLPRSLRVSSTNRICDNGVRSSIAWKKS